MNYSTVSALAAHLLAGSVLLAAAFGATSVRAAPIGYGTALANPTLTIDFSGLADNTYVGSTYAAQGVTFAGLYSTSYFGNGLSGTTAPDVVNYAGGDPSTTFGISIRFSTPVTTAQFYLYTDGYGTTITSLLNDAVVETVTAQGYHNNGSDYFGFSNSRFDEIMLTVNGTGTAVIDNLQEAAASDSPTSVPEPGSSTIMVMGLVGLAIAGGRRRA